MYHPDETGVYEVKYTEMAHFDELNGPENATLIPRDSFTSWTRYAKGGKSRMAILLTDTNSSWLALAHGLKSMGIPFLITRNYKAALLHQVVMVYPTVSGRVLNTESLKALADHPRRGGTLIGVNVVSGGLNETFGFEASVPSVYHYEVRFNKKSPESQQLREPREWIVRLGNREQSVEPMGTYSYLYTSNTPLAYYEDNTVAVSFKDFGAGKAYAFGLDLGFFIQRGYNNNNSVPLTNVSLDGFEPSIDAMLMVLKSIYHLNCRQAVSIGTAPAGKNMALVLTHNVDTRKKLFKSLDFARYEKSKGVSATYFVQAKYISDYTGEALLKPHLTDILKRLGDMGMDIGSKGVSGTDRFATLSLGSGLEKYPGYQPYIYNSKGKSYNVNLLGELRVSKFMLEKCSRQQEVNMFRSPNYRMSRPLALLLRRCGYTISSNNRAQRSCTHLPYQLNGDMSYLEESDVYEFAVTLDDQMKAERMQDRLAESIELAYKLSGYGGLMVLSIDPDSMDYKLSFEKELLEAVSEFAWVGSLQQYANWWIARDKVELDMEGDSVIVAEAPVPINNLALELPASVKGVRFDPPETRAELAGNKLYFARLSGKTRIILLR